MILRQLASAQRPFNSEAYVPARKSLDMYTEKERNRPIDT